jgi:enoyl-[acyl-carrier-protein] reductase (NADH)
VSSIPGAPQLTSGTLAGLSAEQFEARAERPYAAWYAALGAASRRCRDGGVIVALVERPSPLDCAGWSPEGGIADAVEALARSLARSEGSRGVRVNVVTTPLRMMPERVVAPLPPLASFPGSMHVEVLGAVTMLLGDGVAGVTGTVVHADCGRSWR